MENLTEVLDAAWLRWLGLTGLGCGLVEVVGIVTIFVQAAGAALSQGQVQMSWQAQHFRNLRRRCAALSRDQAWGFRKVTY